MSSPDSAGGLLALAFVDELVADPSLLEAYSETFGADDDATLAIWAPNRAATDVAADLGSQADIAADLLLLSFPDSAAADVAARVSCVYSRRPAPEPFADLPKTHDPRLLRLVAGELDAPDEARTAGGPDPDMPERAFVRMPNAGVMREHALRYAWTLDLVADRDVLDLGCGTGYGSEMLTWTAQRVRGFDLWQPNPEDVPAWPGGAALEWGHDLCTDTLPPAEVSVMFEVVEHLADAPAALLGAWQAASMLIVSFPNPRWHGSHHNPYHVNDWPLEQVERELETAARPRCDAVELEHFHQDDSGIVVAGRDPEASYWILVARGQQATGASPTST